MDERSETTNVRRGLRWWKTLLASSVVIALIWGAYRISRPRFPEGDVSPSRMTKVPEDLVKAELHADIERIVPGRVFTVEVRLAIAPGWHIYGADPGDAGLPTTVTFTLPAGFVAGRLQYPPPTEFGSAGDIVTYGYAGQVTLSTHVNPPADSPMDSPVTLRARAQWLACADLCVPGSTDLELELAVAREGAAPLVTE